MVYILVNDANDGGAAKAVLDDVEYTFKSESGVEVVFAEGLNNVPVQRNWRTNIVGKILSGDVQFEVTVDPSFDNDNYNYVNPTLEQVAEGVLFDEKAQTYQVSSAKGLEWLSDNVAKNNGFEGMTIKLSSDIDLKKVDTNGNDVTTPPIGSTGERDDRGRLVVEPFKGTFDGNGKTISNLYQSGWDMSGVSMALSVSSQSLKVQQ